ncbi:MAG: DUF1343 domain-containing protein [Vicinamibacteria bacterium]|jgi:uncharacterized protein YbbC (DUF1343 family)|nr:DUF1343 domain-containing protein [Vicinamibacteria bacterium]
MKRVRTGLEELLARPSRLRGSRVGLIANPTAVTPDLTHAALHLKALKSTKLAALFGPEHGVFANAQDLEEVGDQKDAKTGLRVWSLYGETRVPTAKMLKGLDTLVFDVQDVGSRYYTFIYTMLHAMQACAEHGVRLIVLDRPNPINGMGVQGNVLDPRFLSFVGMHPLAVRHGMTVGELALMFADELGLSLDLEVVPMKGYRRAMDFEDTGLPWVLPSPNMPTVDTAVIYPGGCLIEGTNLSEGRGTTRPFHLVGAPWLDPWKLADDLSRAELGGLGFRPCYFTPTFQKHAGVVCGGVEVHITDRRRVDAFYAYLVLIEKARAQDKKKFAWRKPPYEYEFVKPPIDILCGTSDVREAIEAGRPVKKMKDQFESEARAFEVIRKPYLLYS